MFLPDVNLWLALAFDTHVHHFAALGWFEATVSTSYFCRLTQQGFLRLATNPKVMNEDAVSLKEAWRMYDEILADPLIIYLSSMHRVRSPRISASEPIIFGVRRETPNERQRKDRNDPGAGL